MLKLRAAISLSLFLVACGGDSTGPGGGGPVPVSLVLVSPGSSTILVGTTQQLAVTLTDADSKPLTGRQVTWRSSNSNAANVSSTGLVTALTTGPVTITASSEGKSGHASIVINPVPIASVIVVPDTATLGLGTSSQLSAVPRDSINQPLTGRVFTWVSSNTAAVTVTGTGLLSAVGLGSSTITATSEGKSGTAIITVNPIPVATVAVSPTIATVGVAATTTLTATTKDAGGNVLPGRVVSWSSSAPGKAQVDANGVVTGVTKGTAIITASSEGKSATATITIVPGAPASVTISPNPLSLAALDTARLTAVVQDAAGDTLVVAVVWSSQTPAVATVNALGLVTGVAEGTAIITATSGGITGADTVLVGPAPVATVSVSAPGDHIGTGATLQLGATPRDAQGHALAGRIITWSSSDTTIATVSATGLVLGIAPGTATVTATCEGVTGSKDIVVEAEGVASVLVAPGSAAVGAGLAVQLTASVIGTSGDTLYNRVVTWSSASPGIATVDSNGLVTGIAAGSATITATSEGVNGGAPISVTVDLAFPALDGGYSHTCSLTGSGVTYCWGRNSEGELGSGTISPSSAVPILVSGGVSFASLYPGGRHTCALTASGSVYCWGNNSFGQLGSGDTTSSATPGLVLGGQSFTHLTGGFTHVCGLTSSLAAYCWGSNTDGELGNGNNTQRTIPTPVSGGHSFVALSARGSHTCGLTSTGEVWCWGSNGDGELGDSTTTDRKVPVLVKGGQVFSSITTGAQHTCALTAAGAAWCWGDNALGEIGDGTFVDRRTPVPVQTGLAFASVKARGGHTCALTGAGAAWCWGENNGGQLGDGTTTNRTAPVAVAGGHIFTEVSSGATFSCGVTTTPVLYCWGDNSSGQLGNGTFTPSSIPVKVLGQP